MTIKNENLFFEMFEKIKNIVVINKKPTVLTWNWKVLLIVDFRMVSLFCSGSNCNKWTGQSVAVLMLCFQVRLQKCPLALEGGVSCSGGVAIRRGGYPSRGGIKGAFATPVVGTSTSIPSGESPSPPPRSPWSV